MLEVLAGGTLSESQQPNMFEKIACLFVAQLTSGATFYFLQLLICRGAGFLR